VNSGQWSAKARGCGLDSCFDYAPAEGNYLQPPFDFAQGSSAVGQPRFAPVSKRLMCASGWGVCLARWRCVVRFMGRRFDDDLGFFLATWAFPNTYPGSSRKPLRVSASACWRELTSGLRKFLETQTILGISIPQL
jgi:hypothetical protein